MKVVDIYKAIPTSTCPSNCGECCGMVYPSLAEITNIKTWLKLHHREYTDFNQTEGLDCPYLKTDKSCSIYPVRPYLCRIMGVSSDWRLDCPKHQCISKAKLNYSQTSYLYKQVYLHGKETQRTEKHRVLVNKLFKEAGII